MKAIVAALLLTAAARLVPAQTPVQITAVCPGSLAASGSYPATVTINVFGTGFTPTTRIQSRHPALGGGLVVPTFISSTQLTLTLLGSALSTPGTIDLTALDNRATLTITTASPLPDGVAGSVYSATVAAIGGEPPYTWSATGLPAGLVLNPATGVIAGTPLTVGTSTATVSVKDAANPAQTASASFLITVDTLLRITTTALPYGTQGSPYPNPPDTSAALSPVMIATGGTLPYTWSAPALPAGMTINPLTGLIGGIPTTTYLPDNPNGPPKTVHVIVTDAGHPAQTAFADPSLIIYDPSIYVRSRPSGNPGSQYRAPLAVALAARPRVVVSSNTFSFGIVAAPTLTALTPAQTTETAPLSLNIGGGSFITASQGCPTGTPATSVLWNGSPLTSNLAVSPGSVFAPVPTGLITPGTVTVAVSSPVGVVSNALSLIINPKPKITTTSLPGGISGKAYPPTAITHTGGTLPLAWSLLPAGTGLSIDANGVISGTLPASGVISVQILVRDAASVTDTATLPITILAPPAVNVQPPPVVVLGQQNAVTIALAQPAASTVTGNLSLQFQLDPAVAANRGAVDPLQSLSSTQFTIPQGATAAQVSLQTGLAAGTFTVTASSVQMGGVDVTPAVLPSATLKIAPAPPTIQSACLIRQPSNGLGIGALSIKVNGFSNTRELTRVRFLLAGNHLSSNELDFNNAGSIFGPYYNANFVAFTYQQFFQVSGDPNDISGVSVVLENTQGATTPAFQAAASCP